MSKTLKICDREDGIYFNMPEQEYFSIKRFSASGAKSIVLSPSKFWNESWMNPNREERKPTAPLFYGKAYHKILLEGPGNFFADYAVIPDPFECLETGIQIKEYAKSLGIKRTGKILDVCREIQATDPDARLYPLILEEFKRGAEGKTIISKDVWNQIKYSYHKLMCDPVVKDSLTPYGVSEVVILWTDTTGVQMKARLDRLNFHEREIEILDLKTFSNYQDLPISKVPYREISRNGYFIQPVAYSHALGSILGNKEYSFPADGPERIKDLLAIKKPVKFNFLFVRTGVATEAYKSRFARKAAQDRSINRYYNKGYREYRHGIDLFKKLLTVFGQEKPWIVSHGETTLSDLGFFESSLEIEDKLDVREIR